MKKSMRVLAPLAAVGMAVLTPGVASAESATTFQATLDPLNHVANGSGSAMVSLNGDEATVTMDVSGLAATFMGGPYPHVQHIHGKAKGQCPTPSADKNNDGVVNTTEGQPAYGPIVTTLAKTGDTSPKSGTNVKVAPGGDSYSYQRTFTLSADAAKTVRDGKGVIVVHGLDPTTLSKKAQNEKSDLVPSLPLAATSPALCGVLVASQMSSVPSGGVSTGGGSTSGIEDTGALALGGGLLLAASGALVARRRFAGQS